MRGHVCPHTKAADLRMFPGHPGIFHGWIHVSVKRPNGRVEHWKIETGSPFRMEKRGLKKEDFTIGREVIISGFAAKNGTATAAGLTITFLDRESRAPADEATFILGR